MTLTETALLLVGCAAVLAVLGPQRKRINMNQPPTIPKPAAWPPAPPAVRTRRRTTHMETMTITRLQLEAALLRWAQDARDGKTRSHEDADALPVEQVAAESAAHLWAELSATESA